jgi:hypothetical protein
LVVTGAGDSEDEELDSELALGSELVWLGSEAEVPASLPDSPEAELDSLAFEDSVVAAAASALRFAAARCALRFAAARFAAAALAAALEPDALEEEVLACRPLAAAARFSAAVRAGSWPEASCT